MLQEHKKWQMKGMQNFFLKKLILDFELFWYDQLHRWKYSKLIIFPRNFIYNRIQRLNLKEFEHKMKAEQLIEIFLTLFSID